MKTKRIKNWVVENPHKAALSFMDFATLLDSTIKKINGSLALGFLSFREIAGVILVVGTVLLLSILLLG
ncbi:hypothetical protein [Flagellimonas olearia]|uniref:Uncharacterized protein n=1 Tax=Flagellimonas olearia TaxID=552546 RepID=A0A444VRM9_9FLAO|nr:hypothetical protein [Allomuricauda olearia]RYC53461.1 hypothetical protein DN53_04400 [Allomuricauda olearia]